LRLFSRLSRKLILLRIARTAQLRSCTLYFKGQSHTTSLTVLTIERSQISSAKHSRPPDWAIIILLGALSLISPFAVDMYLPAFSRVAAQFHTETAAISLSLSSYFIGFALGQIFYGPLLDRFGRKSPLAAGLLVYIAASLGCTHPPNLRTLVALRFMQALGGCVAQVSAVAMVRDFFPPQQSARVFSLVFLVIGVSPLLAPTIGSLVMTWLGWPWIFVLLALIAATILSVVLLLLPEPYTPDHSMSLHPVRLVGTYLRLWKQPQFRTYAIAGAFSFSGLFAYVAGSPIIFMDGFHVSAQTFGAIFAVLTGGFIGGSQLNVVLLRRSNSRRIFSVALTMQLLIGIVFLVGTRLHLLTMAPTLVLFFLFLSCIGLTYPNAAAIALAPFSQNVGSASALLGFIQMGTGAVMSVGIAVFGAGAVIALLASTAFISVAVLEIGKRFIPDFIDAADEDAVISTH
jgi:MFS transporter, DHA1 family, multidrug resistance protein